MRSSLFPQNFLHTLRTLPPYHNTNQLLRLKIMRPENKPTSSASKSQIAANSTTSELNKLRQILHSDSTNGWDKCWEEGLTPWDLNSPTPVLVHLHSTGSLPRGRALVPGCGSGHDVVAIACPERHVVGLDISDNALKKASELSSGSPNAEHVKFLKIDFFTWCSPQKFDLIFDYTFFCAIEPNMRSQWARKICSLLKPDGELITLMFPIDDHEGGPPYKVSVTDYEEVLHPLGLKATHIADNELAIASRRGKEKLGRWKRIDCQSSL